MQVDVIQLVAKVKGQLIPCCSSEHEAQQQAWWMIEELTKESEAQLLLKRQIDFSDSKQKLLEGWIKQRTLEKKPIQYILGHVPFCNLDILVRPPVLIPRPETEEWICWLLEKLKQVKNERLNILDIGCGSGCIALALAKMMLKSEVIGIDVDTRAVELSIENKIHNKIKNISFLKSDFYSQIPKNLKFDLIVSNPPYVSDREWDNLSETVRLWEDYKALVARKNGLEAYECIVLGAREYLRDNPKLNEYGVPQIVLEIGRGHENKVEQLFHAGNIKNFAVFKDMEGIKRWVTGGGF